MSDEWTTITAAPCYLDARHLVELKNLAASFRLFADKTRLGALRLLIESGELNVRSLCEQLKQSQPTMGYHLALLRDASFIRVRRVGKHNFHRCIPSRLESLVDKPWRVLIAPSRDQTAALDA